MALKKSLLSNERNAIYPRSSDRRRTFAVCVFCDRFFIIFCLHNYVYRPTFSSFPAAFSHSRQRRVRNCKEQARPSRLTQRTVAAVKKLYDSTIKGKKKKIAQLLAYSLLLRVHESMPATIVFHSFFYNSFVPLIFSTYRQRTYLRFHIVLLVDILQSYA